MSDEFYMVGDKYRQLFIIDRKIKVFHSRPKGNYY